MAYLIRLVTRPGGLVLDPFAGSGTTGEAAMREGRSFELRYRIRHADGRIRWIWELGNVERDANGQMTELTGVFFDITAQHTTEQAMNLLRGRIDAQVGGDYFAALAKGLARVLDVDHVMIGRFLGEPPSRLDTLALSKRDGGNDHLCFDISGAPSGIVLKAGRLDVEDDLHSRYPADLDLAERKSRSYAGRRLDARDGRPLGVLAVLDSKPRRQDDESVALIDLFQARAAAELERVIAQESLQHLADTLENRVAERTEELEAANASLSEAMSQLVQREKMASLGNLVAGIAHELNTPIGNALTVSTALSELQTELSEALDAGALKRSMLERHIRENSDAARLIERNLQRAAELITHFKQVAVDQTSMRRRDFHLDELVRDVLSTVSPLLKRTPHRVDVDISPGLALESYPGPLEQVLTNLIENSLIHGFQEGSTGRILISATQIEDRVQLNYSDDGIGIPALLQHRVFDPFYTSKLGQGGSGLGLYLVYTLVHGPLAGTIQLDDSPGQGARFTMVFPLSAPEVDEEVRA
jgi:signal transduction histidine kinase